MQSLLAALDFALYNFPKGKITVDRYQTMGEIKENAVKWLRLIAKDNFADVFKSGRDNGISVRCYFPS